MHHTSHTWQQLSFFFSSQHVQRYLVHCYEKLPIENAEKKSFENCYPFIYYLEHGKSYYELCKTAPFSIQPMLQFYGMSQLLKACLLTVDPNYPESTTVLAHGVTTRKRKKQGYQFLEDEVKIQKNGLFTHVAERMFHMKHLETEKFTMLELTKKIAELKNLFQYSQKKQMLYKVDKVSEHHISFPPAILDRLHMTKERFIRHIETTCKHLFIHYTPNELNKSSLVFSTPIETWNPLYSTPFSYDCHTHTYYLPTTHDVRNHKALLPELLTHYLLLYNLSMISRYETDWWYDLLGSYASEDYPFIYQFLAVSAQKIPYYISLFLLTQQSAIS
ncbi:YaaC family protein [Bacillus sp. DX1.1]|uniref:YaaC family protein n=1 Tax=unclassified Bacillus (in: firmicutes) TaxID=185979 RepID=UPI002570A915|nr:MULTISPECIES: YaaC family protein [unclassified Bacillus (in: firmicutes)]MDM5152835.1 YaaC family protein [Bacillus sp. DX1.1]WJE81817.1 YaaC family protein [Bacillus sp. DX3.1]